MLGFQRAGYFKKIVYINGADAVNCLLDPAAFGVIELSIVSPELPRNYLPGITPGITRL
jgi:hypothetical protein